MPDETFEEYRARREAENAAKMTDPPTCPIGEWENDGPGDISYPDGTIVRWVCPCGGQLDCYYEAHSYRTFARCQACGLQSDIHTG
jgi:hypothetical protein